MKVMILATGKTEDFEQSYGARLVEQGRAIPAPQEAEEETDCHTGNDTPSVTAPKGAGKSDGGKSTRKR